MSYAVKEIFYTLQGEGAQTGRAAVFCRFAGCNLWSGREQDRAAAVCQFCDTDFAGVEGPDGGRFASAEELAARIEASWQAVSSAALRRERSLWSAPGANRCCNWIGALIDALHAREFEVAVETNGTIAAPDGIDWLCVSPKAGAELVQRTGDELKLVYPQAGATPESYAGLAFRHFFLQPMDGPLRQENTEQALRYCLDHPAWRLGLQTHKFVGIR